MISHTSWVDFYSGGIVQNERGEWMSRYDDTPPGTLTRADLIEALRVNRALLVAAQGDVDYCAARIAREEELIAEHNVRIAKHREDALSAPERIGRIRARIAEQEAALIALGEARVEATKSLKVKKQEQMDALLERIKGGDLGAIEELQKLL